MGDMYAYMSVCRGNMLINTQCIALSPILGRITFYGTVQYNSWKD